MQVHQFHPALAHGGAISNQILNLQHLLRGMGYRSEIFCEHSPLLFEGRAHQIAGYAPYSSPTNVLLLHFSMIYSAEVISWLEQIQDRKVVVYHNITPHHYFAGISGPHFEAAQAGRKQLDRLRELAEAGWGVSKFNCQELADRGWSSVGVLPIIFDPRRYEVQQDRRILKSLQDGLNVLFVGRLVPNKRFEDLILTFYYLKKSVRPDARLLLVGSTQKMDLYLEFLQTLITRLDLPDVLFTGHVSNSQLKAYYQCASVYLCMSEHEGFGVPLLESMHFEVPIIAYKAAAVPETLGNSGVRITAKDYAAVAELIGLLVEDEDLRGKIIARQCERLRDFLPERAEERLRRLINSLEG
jgi:glycosyltransferase involved in cell wall biosynthesis